jgi:hypothetical protein
MVSDPRLSQAFTAKVKVAILVSGNDFFHRTVGVIKHA